MVRCGTACWGLAGFDTLPIRKSGQKSGKAWRGQVRLGAVRSDTRSLEIGDRSRVRRGKAGYGKARSGSTTLDWRQSSEVGPNKTHTMETGLTSHPAWRSVAKQMMDDGIRFGQEWTVEWMESRLRCRRDSNEFKFGIMAIREDLEREAGFYMRQRDNGKVFFVVEANAVEDVCHGFEKKLRNYARRSVTLRADTLANPDANLSESERLKMNSNMEHAAVRLALINRSKSVAAVVTTHKPELLK